MIKIDICRARRVQLLNAALRVESADSGTGAVLMHFNSPCYFDARMVMYVEMVYRGSHKLHCRSQDIWCFFQISCVGSGGWCCVLGVCHALFSHVRGAKTCSASQCTLPLSLQPSAKETRSLLGWKSLNPTKLYFPREEESKDLKPDGKC